LGKGRIVDYKRDEIVEGSQVDDLQDVKFEGFLKQVRENVLHVRRGTKPSTNKKGKLNDCSIDLQPKLIVDNRSYWYFLYL